MRLSLVAAVGRNGVIGLGNAIPWRLPSDLKRFKALTLGHPVVMGRKTYQSIGRPLPGRDNIVVSRRGFSEPGTVVADTLNAALAIAADKAGPGGEVFVIGGAELYRETMPMADRLYVTEVDATPEGDAFFPPIRLEDWRPLTDDGARHPAGDSAATRYVVYERSKPRG